MRKIITILMTLIAGLLWLVPAYLISAYAMNWLGRDLNQVYLLFVKGSMLMEGILTIIKQIIGCFIFSIFLLGVRSGCKYASAKNIIEKNEITKVAYFVGLAPVAIIAYLIAITPLIGKAYNGEILLLGSIVFGIFIVPKMIKKWLALV